MKKILIVDDSRSMINILSSRLESIGYTVDFAKDGDEALNKIKAFNPNLILMDLMLPKISGTEVLRRIGEAGLLNRMSVITMSSNSLKNHELKSLKLGAKVFIKKPFDLDYIENRIRDVL